jgi:nucleoside-diphosphate-sugar epimerase
LNRQHGHSLKPVNDLTPGANPPAIVKFRAALEKDILSARDIMDVLILRPGLVFGGSGSLFGYLWGIIVDTMKRNATTVKIPGTRDIMLGLVHKEDAAEAFRLFVEKVFIRIYISHARCLLGH